MTTALLIVAALLVVAGVVALVVGRGRPAAPAQAAPPVSRADSEAQAAAIIAEARNAALRTRESVMSEIGRAHV